MDLDAFLYTHPVFRHEEFAAWKMGQKPLKAISINTALQHHIKAGRIIGIHRGLLATIPPDQTPKTVTIDPYLIAAKAAPDSLLGYHTALELHGIAYSAFSQLTYLTLQKNKPFEFQNQWFQPSAHPLELRKIKQTSIATQMINRQGMEIQITNLARTYVDILDCIEKSGGWEEACRALSNIATLDIDEVIHYCLMLDTTRLNAKVGYFLEQRQGAFKASEKQLARLLAKSPKSPQYASKRGSDKFELIKKWNLLMPINVIHQLWEEPNANF